MFFIGNQSYVLMPSIENGSYFYAISNPATYSPNPAFINQPVAFSVTSLSLPPSIPSQYVQMQSSASSVLTSKLSSLETTDISNDPVSTRAICNQSRPFTSRTASYDSAQNSLNSSIRRTKSGYISKNRGSKRPIEINLHKSCPGCLKLWRKCQCSNIKNRPDPKPYCKFIPPRMLRKQNSST
ncbi:hypothetical protein BpHYR1_039153 [Brachionus plicatilis]|uniref:Uncharacterized protein n=1 Tax=Brachionus plicatilis TaxID=10195 RepID=A0A3M7QZI8_BRAPC|nr:hypothetical protein BpHYR1_039153 [Brachionus plicatilis]